MLKVVSAFLSVVSLVSVASAASAQCVTTTDTDVVNNETTTWIACGPQTDAQVIVNCHRSTGRTLVGIYPGEFVGGDNTVAQLRGSNEQSPRAYTVRVVPSSNGFVFDLSNVAQVLETLSGSPTLYVRYEDYRDVGYTIELNVSGFAEQIEALACEPVSTEPNEADGYEAARNGDKTKG